MRLPGNKLIEIMDTTLRDGEQTSGVSFSAHEKVSIARQLLSDLGVNRIEIASARVSEGESTRLSLPYAGLSEQAIFRVWKYWVL